MHASIFIFSVNALVLSRACLGGKIESVFEHFMKFNVRKTDFD